MNNHQAVFLIAFAMLLPSAVYASLGNPSWHKPYQPGVSSYVWADAGYDSNVTHQKSENDYIGSSYTVLGGGVQYLYRYSDESYLRARYQPRIGYYYSSQEDNFDDHRIALFGHLGLGIRHAVSFNGTWNLLHEERGTGLTSGFINSLGIDEPVQYKQADLDTKYTYGSKGAKGQIIGGVKYSDRRYSNFRNAELNGVNIGSKFNDYSNVTAYGRFSARVQPVTYWHISSSYADKEFAFTPRSGQSKDNQVFTLGTGVIWEVSEQTQGEASLGYQRKTFDNSQREDFSGLNWKLKAFWSPTREHKLDIITTQSAEDPDQFGDYVNETHISLGWTMYWTSQLASNIQTSWERDNFTGSFPEQGDRKDHLMKLGLQLQYQMYPTLTFNPHVHWEEKSSTWDSVEFSQYKIGIKASLAL